MQSPRTPSEAAPARMAPLARLPVFLDLNGRRAIIGGGGAPAAWKAELLAAAGAEVHVFAAEPGAEMAALPGIALHHRAIVPADLEDAAILVADAEEDGEAASLYAMAKAAGVPCNIIDRPTFCDFTFGAIVNRSPVVVGITTDGAAPILGQTIRRRIETLLPPALGGWTAAAKALRGLIAKAVPDKQARRAAWERFADLAITARGAAPGPEELLARITEGTDSATGGRVTLVGAGPGDAELLTLKAVRALQSADVILFDDLVSAEVLELARREAKRMVVGKRGGRESCSQADINALMLQLARQGKHVVRLKSGDPMIFGRAGEEIETLENAGIPVEVVPGITAALAAASRLGVSLTHRDAAQSVRFLTGHSRKGVLPEGLDWRGLADPATTLMVYMGGRTASEAAGRLIAEGLSADTPVRIVTAVSRPNEKVERTTLAGLLETSVPTDDPVLIAIGRALALGRREAGETFVEGQGTQRRIRR
ncbi:siroheme synthase CysG [Indioceanicola profundi]|uniref:siroheme synthase CysG n=1 Tax=Indioceanicola profundi TaxID=2220096 RepID=UPI000E6AC461|nr:siroheme synthase CysG [Indioceanicola profundi]